MGLFPARILAAGLVLRRLPGVHHAATATAARRTRHVAVVRRLVRILVARLGHRVGGHASQGVPDVGVLLAVATGRFTTTLAGILRGALIRATALALIGARPRRCTATATAARRTRLLGLGAVHRLIDGAVLGRHRLIGGVVIAAVVTVPVITTSVITTLVVTALVVTAPVIAALIVAALLVVTAALAATT